MLRWTVRDWTSVIIGWICGVAAYLAISPHEPMKLFLVFASGFISAWIVRLAIPR
jgi:hypothetical protein